MTSPKFLMLAALLGASAFPSHQSYNSQKAIWNTFIPTDDICPRSAVLDPRGDGLPSASDLFSSPEALLKQVKRHQAIVRVPSVSYDDAGEVGQDKRWEVFGQLHKVLERTYPLVHERATVEKVNNYALLFTIRGSDKLLKPILFAAHQDVVPVQDESQWTYPPFSGHYDGQYIWGRGSVDDKCSLTGIMSVMETLLAEPLWMPRRTILLAFGFDEECTGLQGAGHIGNHLTERYGDDGIAMILDEGGLGMKQVGNVLYAMPSVTEKGHLDVWFELRVPGGHSSVPPPHTGIGIMSEIITALEGHPYKAELTTDDPLYDHLGCIVRYTPEAEPELTELFRNHDLPGIVKWISETTPVLDFLLRTTQAVNVVTGGAKINAMPETVTMGVNYRISNRDGILKVQNNVVQYVQEVVDKYSLTLEAWGSHNTDDAPKLSNWNGTLAIRAYDDFDTAPRSPTSGATWDILSGTIQHTFASDNGIVVPLGEGMLGNTDTRHYWNLTPNIYRFEPLRLGDSDGGHTVDDDERIDMNAHMGVVKFYYDLVRNFDAAEVA